MTRLDPEHCPNECSNSNLKNFLSESTLDGPTKELVYLWMLFEVYKLHIDKGVEIPAALAREISIGSAL